MERPSKQHQTQEREGNQLFAMDSSHIISLGWFVGDVLVNILHIDKLHIDSVVTFSCIYTIELKMKTQGIGCILLIVEICIENTIIE